MKKLLIIFVRMAISGYFVVFYSLIGMSQLLTAGYLLKMCKNMTSSHYYEIPYGLIINSLFISVIF